MRTLVQEATGQLDLANHGGQADILAPIVRPLLQGTRGVLGGQALDALLADKCKVTFLLRPQDGQALDLLYLSVGLRLRQTTSKGGGIEQMTGAVPLRGGGRFPALTRDITGLFALAQGFLELELDGRGVVAPELLLQLDKPDADPNGHTQFFYQVQVYADTDTIAVVAQGQPHLDC